MGHTIQLPDELYSELASYAAQHNQAVETAAAALLSQAILANGQTKRAQPADDEPYDPAKDPLMQIAGSISSGDPSWGDRHDEYLAEAFEDTHEQ